MFKDLLFHAKWRIFTIIIYYVFCVTLTTTVLFQYWFLWLRLNAQITRMICFYRLGYNFFRSFKNANKSSIKISESLKSNILIVLRLGKIKNMLNALLASDNKVRVVRQSKILIAIIIIILNICSVIQHIMPFIAFINYWYC